MAETKNAHEGVVTSIADTDLVMVVGPSGGLHPISFANLKAAIISGIQVGGRNLIPNSAKFTGWAEKTGGLSVDDSFGIFTVRKSVSAYRGLYKIMSFDEGNYYTLSVYANSLAVSVFLPYSYNTIPAVATATASFSPAVTSIRNIGNGWYQLSKTAKCTKSGTAVIEFESSGDNTIRFCAPKLEIGNMVTDWTPAPEDISSAWGGG